MNKQSPLLIWWTVFLEGSAKAQNKGIVWQRIHQETKNLTQNLCAVKPKEAWFPLAVYSVQFSSVTQMSAMCSSSGILWHCLSFDWNEYWPFPVLWPLLSFPNLLAYLVQHFHSIIFQDLKMLNWCCITSTSFVCNDASYSPLDFTFQGVWL